MESYNPTQKLKWSEMKEVYSQKLTQKDVKFIRSIFLRGVLVFLFFGALSFVLSFVVSKYFITNLFQTDTKLFIILPVISIIAIVGLILLRTKWSRNIGSTSWAVIIANYVVLFAFFLIAMVPGLSALVTINYLANDNLVNVQNFEILANLGVYSGFMFGGAIVAYAIPVAIGLMIKSDTAVYNLRKIMGLTIILSFVFIIAGWIITAFAGGRFFFNPVYFWISMVLFSLVGLIAPIISAYKIKRTVPFIDMEDQQLASHWRAFFVFDVLYDLMYLAYLVLRILLFISRRS